MLWNFYIILFFLLGASVKAEEVEFAAELAKRAAGAGGKIKVIDVAKKESEIEVKEMVTLHDVIEGLKEKFPGLTHNRIPVCNSASPLEADFDALCGALIGTNVNCPVIVNCQVTYFYPDTKKVLESDWPFESFNLLKKMNFLNIIDYCHFVFTIKNLNNAL